MENQRAHSSKNNYYVSRSHIYNTYAQKRVDLTITCNPREPSETRPDHASTLVSYLASTARIIMARSIEPLVVGKVIGDVVDMFTPAANFTVHYGSKQVANGCEIKPSAAADMPSVQILAPRPVYTNLYTLVLTNLFLISLLSYLYIMFLNFVDLGFHVFVV